MHRGCEVPFVTVCRVPCVALRAVFREGTGILSVHRQARSCPDRGSLSRKCRPWEELSSLARGQASACPLSCRSPWPSPEGRGSWAKGHTTSVPPEDVAGCQRAHAGRPGATGGQGRLDMCPRRNTAGTPCPPYATQERKEKPQRKCRLAAGIRAWPRTLATALCSRVPEPHASVMGPPRSPGPSGPPGVPELLLGSSCQIPLPAPRPPEALAWPRWWSGHSHHPGVW